MFRLSARKSQHLRCEGTRNVGRNADQCATPVRGPQVRPGNDRKRRAKSGLERPPAYAGARCAPFPFDRSAGGSPAPQNPLVALSAVLQPRT